MKVALIQPPGDDGYPPLSLGYLAAYLVSKGHEARVFDLQLARQRQAWQSDLADFDPGVVGVTAMTPAIMAASHLANEARRIVPDATFVLGGYHVSYLPEDAMLRGRAFDVGVVGEGEVTLHELVEALDGGGDIEKVPGLVFRREGGLAMTEPRERIRDLDSIPWPHEHYDFDHYLWHGTYTGRWTFKCASAIVSRGCPYRCRFCAPQRFWRKLCASCSPERAVEEMKWLARHGARSVFWRDSTFTMNKKWVLEFCEAKRRAGLKTRWICNSRVNLLTEDLLAAMREAGLEALYFGVESGSQRVLDYYNKGITVEQVREAFALCHKHGVETAAYFMVGAPSETRADIEASRRLARDIRAKYTYWFIYTPVPGSEMYDEFLALGYKPDFERLLFNRATIPLADMTIPEIEALQRELCAEFAHHATRGEVWRRRVDIVRSMRSLSDARRLGRKLAHRLGLGKRS